MNKDHKHIRTLGDLRASGYRPRTIKEEMRENLICALQTRKNPFEGIVGFDDTVIPDLQRAILSRHNIILLGLRGQAKTRIARLMVNLLDEYIPVLEACELNDDPFNPISGNGRTIVQEMGDDSPIGWMHRSERYTEKLATPDVSVADLIGDVDPIKAASMKLPYSDERVIHFGLIPHSHRSIFVINELPDLQARIQVALFNILQEEDIQIRGFKFRLPLDIQFVFTANPEDYTNRGSIVTPLKDRIDSQILTHYPRTVDISREITAQESRILKSQKEKVTVPEIIRDLIEQIAFEARESEYVDENSGVSARLSISAYENLYSSAERRLLINNEKQTVVRITDLYGVIPSITGKVELVYEGEQEGPMKIAQILISKAIRTEFVKYFPDPEELKRGEQVNPYQKIIDWFNRGNTIDLLIDNMEKDHRKILHSVDGLKELVETCQPDLKRDEQLMMMEFALHGLAEYSFLNKYRLERGVQFSDMLSGMFSTEEADDDERYREAY